VANAPFNERDADLILRSSDYVDFRVHRVILRIASQFFRTMFTLPQEPASREDIQIEIVDVAEDSDALNCVLRMCYPVVDRPIPTLEIGRSSLRAALKYEMDLAINLCKTGLRGFAASQPLRLYAVACTFEDDEMADFAAESLRLLQYLRTGRKQGFIYTSPTPSAHVSPRRTVDDPPTSCLTDGTVDDPPASCLTDGTVDDPPASCLTDQNADLVIITSDRMSIPVCKAIVTLASPVLNEMLQRPQAIGDNLNPDSESVKKQNQSIFRVPEDSKTMEGLIHICWPAGVPMSISVRWIPRIFMVARKYKMERAMWILQQQWKTLATMEPLRAYLLAASSGWKEEACATARALLSQKFSHIRDTYVPELETTPTGPYYRLLLFHKACGDAAAKVNPQLLDTWTCNCGANWKALHVQRISRSLAIRPSASVFNNETMFGELLQDMGSCFNCQSKLTHVLSTHATYGRMVEEATAKVCFARSSV
ncbi:hypothetical protein POSPLADRAFT_1146985, partial [Postia placenta MAD-698-R-SB12]